MKRVALRSLLVLVALTAMLQARVDSTRWWWSPEVIAELHLSSSQCHDLDRFYESTLPTRRRLAEQIVALADRVQQLNDGDASDEELMPATERLTHAQAERCEMRAGLVAGFDRVLSTDQRATFHALLARKQITPD